MDIWAVMGITDRVDWGEQFALSKLLCYSEMLRTFPHVPRYKERNNVPGLFVS